jgi:hypothetical protein
VARLDALVVGGQRHQAPLVRLALVQQRAAFALGVLEVTEQQLGVGEFEIEARIFLLGLEEHVAVGDLFRAGAAVEIDLVDAVDALHVHRQAFEAVGQLPRDRRAFEAGDLLKIGELRDLHAVAPAFPAQAPGAQRRALPIVLDEAHVVQRGVDADRGERFEIELLQVLRRRLHDHLELVIVLQAIGVLAVAPILGTARGLHIGRLPGFRAERAQGRGGMKSAGADFHVVRLQDHAALLGPITLKDQNQGLERFRGIERGVGAGGRHRHRELGFSSFRGGP